MLTNGEWVMSQNETEAIEGAALVAVEKAKRNLGVLLGQLRTMRQRYYRLADLIAEFESSNDLLRGPGVDLLILPDMEYGHDQLGLAAVKAVTNAVIKARKELAEAQERTRSMGLPG